MIEQYASSAWAPCARETPSQVIHIQCRSPCFFGIVKAIYVAGTHQCTVVYKAQGSGVVYKAQGSGVVYKAQGSGSQHQATTSTGCYQGCRAAVLGGCHSSTSISSLAATTQPGCTTPLPSASSQRFLPALQGCISVQAIWLAAGCIGCSITSCRNGIPWPGLPRCASQCGLRSKRCGVTRSVAGRRR